MLKMKRAQRNFCEIPYRIFPHQLKTPLAALNIYNGIIQGEAKELPTIEEFSQLSEQELDRIETLVQSLLKITKLDAGTIILEKSLENVSELAKNIKAFPVSVPNRREKKSVYPAMKKLNFYVTETGLSKLSATFVKNAL